MIPENFSKTIQKDLITCGDYLAGKKEQNLKVGLAACRILAAVGMAFAALATISAIPLVLTNPVAAALTAATGMAFYAFFHDVFVIAANEETVQNIQNVVNNWLGTQLGFVSFNTNGTFFQPLWEKLITELKLRERQI